MLICGGRGRGGGARERSAAGVPRREDADVCGCAHAGRVYRLFGRRWIKPATSLSARRGMPRRKPADMMLVYFSSGTTGMPKMVWHDYEYPLGHIVTAKYWQCVQENKIHMTQSDSGWAKFAWGKIFGQWICGAAIGAYDTAEVCTAQAAETR